MLALRRCGCSRAVLVLMSWRMLRGSSLVLQLVALETEREVERDGACWLTERRR